MKKMKKIAKIEKKKRNIKQYPFNKRSLVSFVLSSVLCNHFNVSTFLLKILNKIKSSFYRSTIILFRFHIAEIRVWLEIHSFQLDFICTQQYTILDSTLIGVVLLIGLHLSSWLITASNPHPIDIQFFEKCKIRYCFYFFFVYFHLFDNKNS